MFDLLLYISKYHSNAACP